MEILTKTTLIDCTLEELFEFHLDTNNIKLITPSHINKVPYLDTAISSPKQFHWQYP